MKKSERFKFGENWNQFLDEALTEERIRTASDHLARFLRISDLSGSSFLDIGSGSGIHSLAAFNLKASTIFSFDYDQESVTATSKCHKLAGSPANWSVTQGSILDQDFLKTLPQADIVYSWGVLHHTGDMFQAIRNAASLVKPGGKLYIGIYVTTSFSNFWLQVKKFYNNSPKIIQFAIELWWATTLLTVKVITLKSPFKYLSSYKELRGMSFWHDVRDWVGGLPYEDAKIEEILSFCRNEFKFELINLATGERCVEYLFSSKEPK